MAETQELFDFFNSPFPKNIESETTYLDIVNIQTKENINSKIYEYYLNHPIASDWFITALLELIEDKSSKKINIADYSVYTEYATLDKKGRIDIVIESVENKSVIIIENKIHHWLHNDLNNYWHTFNSHETENKVGIVLALSNIPHNNNNFIVITHLEWIIKIESLISEDLLSIREKIHLEDFIINIKYITNLNVMNENIKFYLDHNEKIEKAIKYKEEAARFVLAAIYNIATKYNWVTYGNTLNYKQIWDEQNDIRVFYTLFPDVLLKEKRLKIVIEIDGNARVFYEELKRVLINETDVYSERFIISGQGNTYSAHIGYIQYEVMSDEDFENLESYITLKIEELEPKRKKILSKLIGLGYENKNIPDYLKIL
ncbi:hypothetical protein FLGE108171_02190 [Flavobacterium gelidilacus]|uniref:hypothetical protein n=1 Tax=Flavobacterium gelidilacus TaxID=206041 RepID=UPI00040CED8C|nr:hypothetical protein [Flavobacterium gelidilacus]